MRQTLLYTTSMLSLMFGFMLMSDVLVYWDATPDMTLKDKLHYLVWCASTLVSFSLSIALAIISNLLDERDKLKANKDSIVIS